MQGVQDRVVQTVLLQGDAATPIRALFEEVAHEEGWQPGDQLHAHQERSVYFAVSVDDTLAGGLQLVLPDASGSFPFAHVWPEVRVITPAHTGHAAIMVIRPEFRGYRKLFWPLCVALWRYCTLHKIETIVIEVTPPMLERYRNVGFPLEVIGELRMHWGEECYLCQTDVRSVGGTMLTRALRSPTYRAVVLEAIRSDADRTAA